MRKLLLLLFAVLTFVHTATTQDKPKPDDPKPPLKLESDLPFDGNVDFPDVDGWERSRKIVYPQKELGYSVNYESEEGGRVTVYVFNAGHKVIPDELKGPVAAELKRAKGEIRAVADLGRYQDLKEIKTPEQIVLGSGDAKITALFAKYTFAVGDDDLDSEIYVFPYRNYLVKIRSTRPMSRDGKNAEVDRLLVEIARLFSKGSIVSLPKSVG